MCLLRHKILANGDNKPEQDGTKPLIFLKLDSGKNDVFMLKI